METAALFSPLVFILKEEGNGGRFPSSKFILKNVKKIWVYFFLI